MSALVPSDQIERIVGSGDCWHTEKQWELMAALATHVQDGGEATVDHIIGWEEDADCLVRDVGPAPYVITDAGEPISPWSFAVVINGVLCAVRDDVDGNGILEAITRVSPLSLPVSLDPTKGAE